MKILTAEEMRQVDRRSAEQFGIPLGELMQAAGHAVAQWVLQHAPEAARVLVLCGKGNNGGDGLVAARVLAENGVGVRVLLAARRSDLRNDAAIALAELIADTSGEIIEELLGEDQLAGFADAIAEADLIIDALFGTGFKPPLRGVAAGLRDQVNALAIPVLAVDLPSGWDADCMTQHADGSSGDAPPGPGAPFRADAVLTFTAPRLAHIFGHLTPHRTFGPVVVAPIGSPEEAIVSAQNLTWTGSSKRIAEAPRNINSNKGKFGHVLLVAGSFGKSGAPSMASLAGLRAGAGLVTAAVPKGILTTVALITPELMTTPLEQGEAGAVALAAIAGDRLDALMKGIKVLAVGPGLSTDGEASQFVRALVSRTSVPLVLDADGLNAFAGRTDLLQQASAAGNGQGSRRTVVLTPHPGEMARLLGSTVKEVEADRLGLARRFATEHGVTLVLKGWRTLVAHPDGRVAVNTTGNPALAKGGSGDILTGITAALLAQFPEDVEAAVEAAVYLHGLAGDLAVVGGPGAPGRDEHTVLATDTIAHLSDAFRYRTQDEDGLVWLCGVRAGAEAATR